MNIFKYFILFIVGFISGGALYYLYICIFTTIEYTNPSNTCSIPEAIYYISQPLGILATFLAVIVALFGQEIKNKLFSPKCTVKILDNKFKEFLGETVNEIAPHALQYTCTLEVENTGSKELNELELIVKEVSFKDNGQKTFKKFSKTVDPVIYWGAPDIKKINLRQDEKKSVVIARIFPEATNGTPDSTINSPMRFSLTGYNLLSQNKKGEWKVIYCLQTPQKIIKKITVSYSWDGSWHSREREMDFSLNVGIVDEK